MSGRVFETVILEITDSTPVNLAADTRFVPAGDCGNVFIQCVAGSLRWRETEAAPAIADKGHSLATGDGAVVTLYDGWPFWLWSPTGETAELAVSPAAAAPVRQYPSVPDGV